MLQWLQLEQVDGIFPVLNVVSPIGAGLDIGRVLDFPCEVIGVSDWLPGNPSLAALRKI